MGSSACHYLWPGDPPALRADDRGLAYGDGLFETLRINPDGPVLWEAHRDRFLRGARALGLPIREHHWQAWWRQLRQRRLDAGPAIVKLIVTRGSGGRGYRPPARPRTLWITQRFALPPVPEGPVPVHLCRTRVPCAGPVTGGKTLDRLAQVQASRELGPQDFEGLMMDSAGRLLEGTRSNILLLGEGVVVTPPAASLAVDGVLRQALLGALRKRGWQVRERPVRLGELGGSQGLVLVNSVFGVVPVGRIGCQRLPLGPQVETIRQMSLSGFGV